MVPGQAFVSACNTILADLGLFNEDYSIAGSVGVPLCKNLLCYVEAEICGAFENKTLRNSICCAKC